MSCRNIMGDSLNMAKMNKNLKSVSMFATTECVFVTDKYEMSTKGDDLGSSYYILECKHCEQPIGKMYNSTPKALDSLRDLYTLDWNKIKTYELGVCSNKKVKVDETNPEMMAYSMMISLNETVKSHEARLLQLESLIEVIEEDENENMSDVKSNYDDHLNQSDKKRKLR
ncbi:kinetochore protein mis18-like [Xenia sp. Carnegie-2017]|uniref:kinetochore protein mis18-like n=1 Tax=Xenia sp. Carnegie-2017 TaxID=2897299 RepID=UPI001F039EDF|nr:kinetochore protein mis18-like [Xenia sp. Carnegie-2017]